MKLEFFLDLPQTLLAEEHFITDEESRDAEGAARGGRVGVGGEFRLDLGILSGNSSRALASRPAVPSTAATTVGSSSFWPSSHMALSTASR